MGSWARAFVSPNCVLPHSSCPTFLVYEKIESNNVLNNKLSKFKKEFKGNFTDFVRDINSDALNKSRKIAGFEMTKRKVASLREVHRYIRDPNYHIS